MSETRTHYCESQEFEVFAKSISNPIAPSKQNMDNFFVNDNGTAAVFDGAGHNVESVYASRAAVDSLTNGMAQHLSDAPDKNQAMIKVFHEIQNGIIAAANRLKVQKQLGTTGTIVHIYNGQLIVGNIGDNHAYLAGDHFCIPLTIDDTHVGSLLEDTGETALADYIAFGSNDDEIARFSNELLKRALAKGLDKYLGVSLKTGLDVIRHNAPLRALGAVPNEEGEIDGLYDIPTVRKIDISRGNRLILTTDGVHKNIHPEIFSQIALKTGVEKVAKHLISEARKNCKFTLNPSVTTGADDMTAVVLKWK